jgi:hypothetical protein
LHAFRGDVLALTIRTLADGARLEVNQHGTGFTARRERRAAPSIATTAVARTEDPRCAERASEAALQPRPVAPGADSPRSRSPSASRARKATCTLGAMSDQAEQRSADSRGED